MGSNFSQVTIVGGGFIGSLMAGVASRLGLSVLLIDRLPLPSNPVKGIEDGRAISLTPATCHFFKSLGLWDSIEAAVTPLKEIHTFNQKQGPVIFSEKESGGMPLGCMIPASYLQKAIGEWLSKYDTISYAGEVEISHISGGMCEATLTGQQRGGDFIHSSSLIIGADGRNSLTRSLVGLRVRRWSYNQRAFVTTYCHEKSHAYKAYEYFLPTGPFAILPLQGEHHSSIVWSVKEEYAQELAGLSDDEFDARVSEHMEKLGPVARAGKLYTYPLEGHFVPSFVSSRFCLIGDSAHGIHPLAGQGLNLGITDVKALGHMLEKAIHRGLDIGSYTLLKNFQHQQRLQHIKLLTLTHGLNWLFSNNSPALNLVRGQGFNLMERVTGLKRFFALQGMGPS